MKPIWSFQTVSGRIILRSSHKTCSANFGLTAFSELPAAVQTRWGRRAASRRSPDSASIAQSLRLYG